MFGRFGEFPDCIETDLSLTEGCFIQILSVESVCGVWVCVVCVCVGCLCVCVGVCN